MITLAVARLRRKRQDLWLTAGSIATVAATDNRYLTPAEAAEYASTMEQLTSIDRRIAGALEAEQERAEIGI